VLVRRGPRLLSILESHGRPPGLRNGADVLVVGLRAFLPPSPFFFSSGERVAWTGEDSPKAARVGSSRGAAAAATYSGGRRRAHGRQGCAGRRAAASRRHPVIGAAALGPPASLKEKGGG
jgi:hypothetical protein